jgi:hypothetical protein
MTFDYQTAIEITNEVARLFGDTLVTKTKKGRTGYALILGKDFTGRWYWTIETQNGVEVTSSSLSYSRRYDAIRSAKRLVGDNLKHFYVEYDDGSRDEL